MYFGARYYNPHLSRWLSADPLFLLQTDKASTPDQNLYTYASNNPWRFVDPNGLFTLGVCGVGINIGGGESSGSSGTQEIHKGTPSSEHARGEKPVLNASVPFGQIIQDEAERAGLDGKSMTERMVIGPGKALKSIIVGTAKTALKAGGHIGHRIRHGSWHPDAKRDIVSFGIDLVMTYAGGKVLQRLAKTRLGTWISKNSSIQIPNSGTTQRLNSGIRSAIKTAGGVAVTKPSSRALSQALEAGGHVRPAASAAHHIVAGGAEAAAPARAVLKRFGIGINNAANGVFLPASRAAPNAEGAAVHSTLHTRPYYQAVNDALGQATTRGEALEALGALRQGLLGGGL